MAKFVISADEQAVSRTLSLVLSPLPKENGVFLWCLENNKEVKNYYDLLLIWQEHCNLKNKIIAWPDKEIPDLATLSALYQNQPAIILTTANNLNQAIPDWQQLKDQRLSLELGQIINLPDLIQQLVSLGLSRENEAWHNQTFSVNGSLINLCQNNTLYRLNVWENKLENIKAINLLDNNTSELKNLNIWPAKIVQTTKLGNNWPNRCTLITDQPEILKFNFSSNNIIFDNLSVKPDFKLTSENIDLKLSQNEQLKFLLAKQDWQVFWFNKNQTLAQELIKKQKLNITLLNWQQGLSWPRPQIFPDQKIIVVNDNLFFLTDEEKSQAPFKEFMPDFQIGDLVVHRDHGIGQLEKITELEVDGLKHEYLVLSYADNDTLFVPLDLADKVEKYVGPANPKINRLSVGNNWPQTLRKIKAETWTLANQLLQIEAARKLHLTPSFTKTDLLNKVINDFPYQATPSQAQAINDVLRDLKASYPADRLICGDVGFGKTEVALRAAAVVADSGWQVALLCPTTILAQQHYDNFTSRLEKYHVRIGLLTRWQTDKEIQETLGKIKNGEIDIIIGTHRLLSRDIQIPKLQLLIIDEEQNFGVEDKEKLKKRKAEINVLTLSATPIPRTLNMALSLIKDISLITHPITDRKDIITQVSPTSDKIIQEAINRELLRKGQVYFLHNRVETINFAYQKINKLFPQAKIAIAHGQMEDKELAEVMHQFDTGKINILICSTIIANGLDIPNANTLIITEADRFGLSQLHQLRGRIGRSHKQAFAYFLYNAPKLPKLAAQRLAHLKLASGLGDGFKIAHRDLELRGVGQILGKAQSGKVKSIGLGLYQQLIAETIAELKGNKYQNWREVELKINLDISLPEKFFKSPEDKLSFYQKIARMHNLAELEAMSKKITNENHLNLLWLQKIKILCQQTNITSLNTYRGQGKEFLSINFLPPLNYQAVEKLLKINPAWKFTDSQLKIDKSQLGNNIKLEIEKVISLFK